MAGYNQPGTKRQKVKEGRVDVDYFQGIDKLEYNNTASPSETTSYRYYNASERIHSRSMEEWLKFSVSLTEFRHNGWESAGRPSNSRPWDDNTQSMDNHKRCIKALFDLCNKLGVKYWTAFDTDLIPMSDSWEENRVHWDDIVEYIQELSQKCHVKLLWLAPDLHSHPRYTSGAFTSNDAATFVQAATQIKKCLEISQRLNAECFLLWPYREGYDAIFQTDVAREIKLFAKLLKITTEYKDRLNFRCQLLIMPYYGSFNSWQYCRWREGEVVNSYMWDVTSCLYFLKNYNLDRHYKVCSVPGHHMFMANVYNMLGGVTITNDVDHFDSKNFTLMMKCIVDQGSPPAGGIALRLHTRREVGEFLPLYLKYVDAISRALRLACHINADQIFAKQLQHRYASYYSGFGSRIASTDLSLEDCEELHKKNQPTHSDVTSKYEHFNVVFQRYIDTCDHI